MARYINRFAAANIILRTEVTKLVFIQGEAHPFVEKPALVAQFRQGLESSFERQYAIAAFSNKLIHNEDGTVSFGEYLVAPTTLGNEPAAQMRLGGAFPDLQSRTIALPNMTQMLNVDGYDITQKMSTFDTEWPGWSKEDKAEAERLLDAGAGQDYFKVGKTRVEPPWATYDEMRKGQGGYMKVIQFVKDGGYNPAAVLAYEEQLERPFDGIVNGLREYIDEILADQRDQEALTTQVQ